jgi:plasmid stability protein
MPDLIIPDLDPVTDSGLRARAAARGRSMEEEARLIIQAAVSDQPRESLVELARTLFGPENGICLTLPPRPIAGDPPKFG